jgi:endo-1,4-beta-xylanase
MDTQVGYNLYLPPNYEADKDKRYPVMYWLHGLDQCESTNQYPIDFLDNAIKSNQLPPMIVVYASGGQRTYYTDNPALKSLPETQIIKELIPHVDSTYRTNARREQRAIFGMSMGGFGALKLAFKYPELFSSVTAFAPGIRDPQSFAKDRADILLRMFNNDPANYDANHPATLLKQNLDQIKGKLPITIHCGTTDYLLAGNRALHQSLTDLKIDHTYIEYPNINHNLVKLSAETKAAPFVFAAKHFK